MFGCFASIDYKREVFDQQDDLVDQIEFFTDEGAVCPWPEIRPATHINANVLSDETIDMIADWISNCTKDHPLCALQQTCPKLPTRVIYVGPDSVRPNLFVTQGALGLYAALSYCWGNARSFITTQSTMSQREQGMDVADLPRTLQDAISVTQRLGIQYLWIDSLCIIQDSKEDWDVEASRMCDIYANAHVTISADTAPDSDTGFREVATGKNVVQVSCPLSTGSELTVYARPFRNRRNAIGAHTPSAAPQSRLSTRAWVLQERLLSPRLIHFTKHEVTWECNTMIQCECEYKENKIPEQYGTFEQYDASGQSEFKRKYLNPQFWQSIVREYTSRDLSYSSDRLAAFSGIAARLTSGVSSGYLAGLRKSHICEDLLWRTVSSKDMVNPSTSRRHDAYQAPSWSWASVTGPIRYPDYFGYRKRAKDVQLDLQFEVLDTQTMPFDSNAFGPVQNGFIDCIGVLIEAQIFTIVPDKIAQKVLPDKPSLYFCDYFRDGDEIVRETFNPDVRGDEYEIRASDQHWVLLIKQSLEGLHGIALRKSQSDGTKFERVGYYTSPSYPWKSWWKVENMQRLTII